MRVYGEFLWEVSYNPSTDLICLEYRRKSENAEVLLDDVIGWIFISSDDILYFRPNAEKEENLKYLKYKSIIYNALKNDLKVVRVLKDDDKISIPGIFNEVTRKYSISKTK